MQKSKIVLSITLAVLFLSGVSFYYVGAQEKNWEGGKVAAENKSFIDQMKKMQEKINGMTELVGDVEEYCNSMGCWKNDNGGQDMNYEGKQGKWSSDNFAQIVDFDDGQGNIWKNDNFGQVLTYNSSLKEEWISDNFGQDTVYNDGKGNVWKSDNFGQILTYVGTQGKWKSDNFGQDLKYSDGSKEWNQGNFGQGVNYRDNNGNVWDENDLNNEN